MNLNAYDKVLFENLNWIDPKYKRFYSKTIPKRNFFTILKRYNGQSNDWYLLLSDVTIEGYVWEPVKVNKNYQKYDLYRYWETMGLDALTSVTEVNVKKEEENDEYLIYYLDI